MKTRAGSLLLASLLCGATEARKKKNEGNAVPPMPGSVDPDKLGHAVTAVGYGEENTATTGTFPTSPEIGVHTTGPTDSVGATATSHASASGGGTVGDGDRINEVIGGETGYGEEAESGTSETHINKKKNKKNKGSQSASKKRMGSKASKGGTRSSKADTDTDVDTGDGVDASDIDCALSRPEEKHALAFGSLSKCTIDLLDPDCQYIPLDTDSNRALTVWNFGAFTFSTDEEEEFFRQHGLQVISKFKQLVTRFMRGYADSEELFTVGEKFGVLHQSIFENVSAEVLRNVVRMAASLLVQQMEDTCHYDILKEAYHAVAEVLMDGVAESLGFSRSFSYAGSQGADGSQEYGIVKNGWG